MSFADNHFHSLRFLWSVHSADLERSAGHGAGMECRTVRKQFDGSYAEL